MRVITGTAGGRPLHTLSGLDVRPTVAKVKEALFSSIQFEVEGSRVLDLFAGSGQLGIECLSRGAAQVTFVDNSASSLGTVRKNLNFCSLTDGAHLVKSDAISYLRTCSGGFDIVLLDPPYDTDLAVRALELLTDLLSETGVVVCETAYDKALPDCVGALTQSKQKKYGKTKLTYYRKLRDV